MIKAHKYLLIKLLKKIKKVNSSIELNLVIKMINCGFLIILKKNNFYKKLTQAICFYSNQIISEQLSLDILLKVFLIMWQ